MTQPDYGYLSPLAELKQAVEATPPDTPARTRAERRVNRYLMDNKMSLLKEQAARDAWAKGTQ